MGWEVWEGAGGAHPDCASLLLVHKQVLSMPASPWMEEKVNEKIENPTQAQPWTAKKQEK
jgi:hypothetical protein